jgi:nicotinamidase-related amidase
MNTFTKVGLDALLTPENCVLLLIDHQPSQLANVNSHEPTMVINNVTAPAKSAKAYGVPTILTTINAKCGGEIFKQIQAVFPDQKPIDRSFINSWEDRRVVEAVQHLRCHFSEINATRSNKSRLDSRNRCDWSAAR